MPIKIGYWEFRGLGQISRYLLQLTGQEFEEITHDFSKKSEGWDKEKFTLGFDFPNMPYLIDGDLKLTESSAVNQYIIEKSGKTELLGKSPEDKALVEEVIGVLSDIRSSMFNSFFAKEIETDRAEAFKKISAKLSYLEKAYNGKVYVTGYLTVADVHVANWADYLAFFYDVETFFYPFLKRVNKNFLELPEIKKYFERPTAITKFIPPFIPNVKDNTPKVLLGYWNARGKAGTIRLLLTYYKVDFIDHLYQELP